MRILSSLLKLATQIALLSKTAKSFDLPNTGETYHIEEWTMGQDVLKDQYVQFAEETTGELYALNALSEGQRRHST